MTLPVRSDFLSHKIITTVFCRINVPGTEAENEPYPYLISMNLIRETPAYRNIKCWKNDGDRLRSFWDMVGKLKVGGAFIQARAFIIRQNTVDWKKMCFVSFEDPFSSWMPKAQLSIAVWKICQCVSMVIPLRIPWLWCGGVIFLDKGLNISMGECESCQGWLVSVLESGKWRFGG